MASNELTGIERQLVLQYLMDGNVPVTVIPIENGSDKNKSDDGTVPAASSGVFPVALRAEQMTVLNQGIILLKNAPGSVKKFAGLDVRVEFYFNKLGLSFVTKMKQVSSGLAIVIPTKINKVVDSVETEHHSFSVVLFYESGKKNSNINIDCVPEKDYRLFEKPRWSDVEESEQKLAKSYLEKIVLAAKEEKKNIGNGVYLISVVKFLSHPQSEEISSIENRVNPPSVLYIDYERIVFGSEKKNMILTAGTEYALKIGFPIESGPVKERAVYVTCAVEQTYDSDDGKRSCAVCRYTSIKEEDVRFLFEKIRKEKFDV